MPVPRFPDHQSVGKYLKQLDTEATGRLVDNVTAVSTADGSDPATTQALANALKAKLNTLLAELKEAGVMAPDA